MPVNILHCHSTFDLGGKEARSVALMNAFGDTARHTVLSGVPGAFGARDAIAPGISVRFPDDAPSLTGRPSVARYRAIAEYLRGFDLILTYNWGAMDAVMARRIFAKSLPPLVHHEDGFNADESARLKTERTLMRRLGFPAAYKVVVPSQTLEKVALETWKQPPDRIRRIPNGIVTAAYATKPRPVAIRSLKRKPGEIVIGTVAGLRSVKNIPRLVRAVLSILGTRLVVVGEGPERDAIAATAAALGVANRLILTGFLPDPHRYMGLFDIFALSSDSEQFPIALVEAMAAGLPVVSTRVGDVPVMLPPEQQPFITACDDYALAGALRQLVADASLRKRLGTVNQVLATKEYDQSAMVDAYRRLYSEALGDQGAYFR
ncbi:MAG: glycosyltransferase family 4 protein [Sphingomonadales bacterium]